MDFPNDFSQSLLHLSENEISKLKTALNSKGATTVRINKRKNFETHPHFKRIPWASNSIILPERPKFTLDPLFQAGGYYVQEAASMFLEQGFSQIAELKRSIRALDLCAAPGGKSTHLIDLLSEGSLLVSNEIIHSRVGALRDNLSKWGDTKVLCTNNSAADFGNNPNSFDFILVDAPCSGEGMFRDKEAREQWSIQNVGLCASRQRKILAEIWPALKPGGILCYSTCTFNLQENEENLKWLSTHNELEFIELSFSSEWGIVDEKIKGVPGYRFYPHATQGEGFFVCFMQKSGPLGGAQFKNISQEKHPKRKGRTANKNSNHFEEIKKKVSLQTDTEIVEKFDMLYAFPKSHVPFVENLIGIKLKKLGVCLGEMKGKNFVPHHELALSVSSASKFPSRELTLQQALQFLKKQDFFFDSDSRGFILLTHKGLGLGWVKHL